MFTDADKRHLDAAEGWLGLTNWREANEELENITLAMRSHPDVLRLRWEVCRAAKQWELAAEIGRAIAETAPNHAFGWIHCAYALHEMNRTAEARAVLLPVVDKFPGDYVFAYNLACYECHLGNLAEARRWIESAIDRAGKEDVRTMALDDPDLQPLWTDISEI